MGNQLKLSPTTLNLYLDCAYCFWLQFNHKIKRPEGLFSSLPGGIDNTLKLYYDYWRKKNSLPPLLKGKLPGKLIENEVLIKEFRSTSKFGFYDDKLNLWFGGALDDALILEDDSIIPIDNKTRGYPISEPHEAHILQMSAYTLILKRKGIKTKNMAYLVYFYFDHKNADLENPLDFNIAVEEVETDPKRIEKYLTEAVELLKGPQPKSDPDCGFCRYRKTSFL